MKYELRVGADTRSVSIERNANGELRVAIERSAPNSAGAKVFAAVEVLEIGLGSFSILFKGASFDAQIIPEAEGLAVFCRGREFHATVRDPRAWKDWKGSRKGTGKRTDGGLQQTHGRQEVVAPMPGKIVRVLVAAGQNVEVGQGLVVVEAMKMQNEIRATKSGQAARLLVREGQTVSAGDPLLVIT
jgi:biotin carboxyl carrier protein